jgi:NADPH-dependent curcumin reductase CurA
MSDSVRYISLKAHIEGLPKESDFELHEAPLPELKEGQFIAENHYVSVDPGMRSRLSGEIGLAKHWGAASVTGIAGSDEKCVWLTEKAGFDTAIN